MPPLNHKTDLQHVETLYEVCMDDMSDTYKDGYHRVDADLVTDLESALEAAMTHFNDDPKMNLRGLSRSSGVTVLYEPHDGDEDEYKRAIIKQRKVYGGG